MIYYDMAITCLQLSVSKISLANSKLIAYLNLTRLPKRKLKSMVVITYIKGNLVMYFCNILSNS